MLFVIKIGGNALEKRENLDSLMHEITTLYSQNHQIVLVHGGGPQIDNLASQLGIHSERKDGMRVTSPQMLTAAHMALMGQINPSLVTHLNRYQQGVAVGFSALSGQVIQATQYNNNLGLVGEVTLVRPQLLRHLITGGFIPILSPISSDDKGQMLNLNADTVAGEIAKALRADILVYLSNIPGLLDAQGKHISQANCELVAHLIHTKAINGSMLPKVESITKALHAGVKEIWLLDGRQDFPLSCIAQNTKEQGTRFIL